MLGTRGPGPRSGSSQRLATRSMVAAALPPHLTPQGRSLAMQRAYLLVPVAAAAMTAATPIPASSHDAADKALCLTFTHRAVRTNAQAGKWLDPVTRHDGVVVECDDKRIDFRRFTKLTPRDAGDAWRELLARRGRHEVFDVAGRIAGCAAFRSQPASAWSHRARHRFPDSSSGSTGWPATTAARRRRPCSPARTPRAPR